MENEMRYRVIKRNLSNRKEVKEVYHYEAKPSIYPLFEKCPFISPYNYCANNSVNKIDPTGMEDGDFYDESETYLKTDKKKDDNVFIVTDPYSQRTIKKNTARGQTAQAEDVNVEVATTYDVLGGADVYGRIVMSGGGIDEASAMDKNGTWHRATGTEEKVDISISAEKGTIIHSHPFTEGQDNSYSTPQEAGRKIVDGDIYVFKAFDQNIIVGKSAGRNDPVLDRINRIPTMSFFNNNGSDTPCLVCPLKVL